MKPDLQTREDNYRKAVELAKRNSKPKGGFRSIGDDLSGHEAAMITFGVKADVERESGAKRPAAAYGPPAGKPISGGKKGQSPTHFPHPPIMP
jgi:hypothetical protein